MASPTVVQLLIERLDLSAVCFCPLAIELRLLWCHACAIGVLLLHFIDPGELARKRVKVTCSAWIRELSFVLDDIFLAIVNCDDFDWLLLVM